MNKDLIAELNLPSDIGVYKKKGSETELLSVEEIPDSEFHRILGAVNFVRGANEEGKLDAYSQFGWNNEDGPVTCRVANKNGNGPNR